MIFKLSFNLKYCIFCKLLYKISAIILLINLNFTIYSQEGVKQSNYPVLHYVSAKSLNLDTTFIYSKIDSIVNNAIKQEAFPGCQILAAKNGAIFFYKTYGFHTYDSINRVKKSDLYDWASVTKITGTLPAIMKLYDEGKLNLDTPFSVYWKPFKHSNKKDITLREILTHQARLQAWLPYWLKCVKKNGEFKRNVIRKDSSKNFSTKIGENMYVRNNYYKKIYKAIKKSSLLNRKAYKYSGLAFFIFPKLIEQITGENYEEYVKKYIYKPIGANTVTYNPLRYYPKSRIILTEYDSIFRKQQIQGYVHDEGAALMSGVSGNAGLFGTTLDLAKIMQMYQNGGAYGNTRIISDSTIKLFTSYQDNNLQHRRGLGFDKPMRQNKNDGYTAIDASESSFGHSGFTGTFAWADPQTGILLIFMSNRVYPSRKKMNLYNMGIRPAIHQVFYEAFKRGKS